MLILGVGLIYSDKKWHGNSRLYRARYLTHDFSPQMNSANRLQAQNLARQVAEIFKKQPFFRFTGSMSIYLHLTQSRPISDVDLCVPEAHLEEIATQAAEAGYAFCRVVSVRARRKIVETTFEEVPAAEFAEKRPSERSVLLNTISHAKNKGFMAGDLDIIDAFVEFEGNNGWRGTSYDKLRHVTPSDEAHYDIMRLPGATVQISTPAYMGMVKASLIKGEALVISGKSHPGKRSKKHAFDLAVMKKEFGPQFQNRVQALLRERKRLPRVS